MQQSSLEFFCEECGAANPDDATLCIACQQPLTRPPTLLPAPVKPTTVAPAPMLQVTANTTPTTPTTLSDALSPGTLLQNRYKIECEIGQGGYSIVYKARDTRHHGHLVALKQINLRNLTSRQAIEATETFNRETTLLPLLRHAGIPRFYGHFTDPEHWYLVMEYIKGQTLEHYLQEATTDGYCSVEDTLRIGVELSSVLDYLHAQKPPLIFRDVKPANILLTPSKKLYLIDFGIARTFKPSKAKDTTPLGSPGYAAPEQYGRAQSDQRTDIYGLGATLQTLLTGRDPLELRAGEPSRAPQPAPSYVQKLLASMMDPNPALRPGTMGIVKQDLQNALARVRRIFLYCQGAGLGAAFFFSSYLMFFLSKFQFYPLYPLFACFWGIAAAAGLVAIPFSLATPSRRMLALGLLTAILLALLLLIMHVIPSPFPGNPFSY